MWHEPSLCHLSVVCLSSVTVVHPTHGVELFGNILQHLIFCKGVRCPPIFSLSNLINAGWLVRKCVNIHIHPLIAGTNRKAYLLHVACCMLSSRVQEETPVIRRTSFPSTVVGDRSRVVTSSHGRRKQMWIGMARSSPPSPLFPSPPLRSRPLPSSTLPFPALPRPLPSPPLRSRP